MKTKSSKFITKTLAALALAMLASSSFAASTWAFGSTACQSVTSTTNFGNSATCGASIGSGTVSVYAWGAGAGAESTGYRAAFLSPQGSASGYGVKSQLEGLSASPPEHSMDNNPDANLPDLILLKFNTSVALDTVKLGWSQSDADFTVMAYTGNATLTDMQTLITGKNASTLTGNGTGTGWALVENSGDPDTSTVGYSSNGTDIQRTVNNGSGLNSNKNVSSSWWLISAYSAGFGGGSMDSLVDYVKVLGVSTKDVPGKVPEPGSIALLGLGLIGIVGVRRRKQPSM